MAERARVVEDAVLGVLDSQSSLLRQWQDLKWGNLPEGKQKYQPLLERFGGIWEAYWPLAAGLIQARMKRFPTLDEAEKDDILQQQRTRLWDLVGKFRWSDFANGRKHEAASAFAGVLVVSTGSFFAREKLERQRTMRIADVSKRKGDNRIRRVTEEAVEARQDRQALEKMLSSWRSTGDLDLEFLELRCGGLATKQIATARSVGETMVRRRVARGKHKLLGLLRSSGYQVDGAWMTKDNRDGVANRAELLAARREKLEPKYQLMAELIPPKVRRAGEVFYGLGGNSPTFDYQETARITGMSFQSVRVYVPQVARILLGTEAPSERCVERRRKERLYEWWKDNNKNVALDRDMAEILDLYFKRNLKLSEVAKKIKTSEETARRRVIAALNLIEVVSDIKK